MSLPCNIRQRLNTPMTQFIKHSQTWVSTRKSTRKKDSRSSVFNTNGWCERRKDSEGRGRPGGGVGHELRRRRPYLSDEIRAALVDHVINHGLTRTSLSRYPVASVIQTFRQEEGLETYYIFCQQTIQSLLHVLISINGLQLATCVFLGPQDWASWTPGSECFHLYTGAWVRDQNPTKRNSNPYCQWSHNVQ